MNPGSINFMHFSLEMVHSFQQNYKGIHLKRKETLKKQYSSKGKEAPFLEPG